MRAGFGLIALMVSMAIILFLLAGRGGGCSGQSYLQTVTSVKKEKEPLVQQWGGKDPSGQALYDTLELAPWPETGAMRGARVETIDATGAAATFYGLQIGDVITQINAQEVGGYIITSAEDAEAFLTDAFRLSAPIVVRRGDRTLTLPDEADSTDGQSPPPAGGTLQLPDRLPGQ